MNYDESISYIQNLSPTILNPDLRRFAAFMKEHGDPQNGFATVHIAGTNGKGSTAAIIDSVFVRANLKCGRFTGPHLLRWNERFHINSQAIDDITFAALATKVRLLSDCFGTAHPELGSLSWFEFLTAIAFFWFAEQKVDVAVIEVGLGGRWDATNVISRPLATAITSIDYDHMHILGDTLPRIAGEKAGIIKRGVPVVTAACGDALDVIEHRATECGAPLYIVGHGRVSENIDWKPLELMHNALALEGAFQQSNLQVAYVLIALVEKSLSKEISSHLADGLKSVYWPGRFQYLPDERLVLDGAHNSGGIKALRESLDRRFPDGRRLFVLSFFESKDMQGALDALLREKDLVYAAAANSPRATCKPEAVALAASLIVKRSVACPSIADALASAKQDAKDNDLIVSTGSFATVKECMLALGWNSVEDGLAHMPKKQ